MRQHTCAVIFFWLFRELSVTCSVYNRRAGSQQICAFSVCFLINFISSFLSFFGLCDPSKQVAAVSLLFGCIYVEHVWFMERINVQVVAFLYASTERGSEKIWWAGFSARPLLCSKSSWVYHRVHLRDISWVALLDYRAMLFTVYVLSKYCNGTLRVLNYRIRD